MKLHFVHLPAPVIAMALAVLVGAPRPADAQPNPAAGGPTSARGGAEQPSRPAADAPRPSTHSVQTAPHEDALSVTVRVVHGGQSQRPLSGKPVFLRAARPKGPFEPTDPEPRQEWSAVTGPHGKATFDQVPRKLADQGLRLHAVTTHGNLTFKSAPKVPAAGIELTVPVYEHGRDVSAVEIKDLQTIVHVWEDSLFFQQFYRLTVGGDQVLDVSELTDKKFENGLPIELPVKARGINVKAPGTTKVVNSIAYWKGTLKPGETVPINITYTMTATSKQFVYEQTFDYPADKVTVVVPLESRQKRVKVAFFDQLALTAPGFDADQVSATRGSLGRGSNSQFLTAKGASFNAGETLKFGISGLPFDHAVGNWVALGLGLAGALVIFGVARREKKRVADSQSSGEIIGLLSDERDALLDDLALLERDFEAGQVSELEYERESLLLRERIALVMKKISDLQDSAA